MGGNRRRQGAAPGRAAHRPVAGGKPGRRPSPDPHLENHGCDRWTGGGQDHPRESTRPPRRRRLLAALSIQTCSFNEPGDMTKTELAARVADKVHLTNRQAEAIVGIFLTCISEALQEGDKVELRGFGSFRTRSRQCSTRAQSQNRRCGPGARQEGTLLQGWQGVSGRKWRLWGAASPEASRGHCTSHVQHLAPCLSGWDQVPEVSRLPFTQPVLTF